jgi:DNA-binding CsgD family transcriptional regulator/tetratricopeptide (TPR) repeat protein
VSLEAQGLLERDQDLTAIDAALDGAALELGRVVAIEGPAGIGKTRLLEAARTMAQDRGFRVLSARAGERERGFSWGVVRHLFEPVLGSATPEERERLWEGAAEGGRALFESPATESTAGDSSFAVQHALFWLTANLAAEKPVLIAVDDLHWCDAPSLGFIDYLGRQLEALPIVVAGTMRPNEPGSDQALIDSFVTGPAVERIEPRSLSEEGSLAVLRSELDGGLRPELARACFEATGGNPLLLNELARGLRSTGGELEAGDANAIIELGSRAVARTVEMRLEPAGEGPTRLAEAASVLGENQPIARAIELTSLADREGDEAAIALSRIDVLQPGTTIRFVHPVVRSAVYERIGPRERARLHAESARILRAGGSSVQEVAGHLIGVDPSGDPDVVATLRDAAGRAMAGGDLGTATAYLRRAIDEPPPEGERVAVLAELGTAEALIDIEASVAHLREALELTDEPALRAAIAEILALGLQFQERFAEGVEVAREVLGELEPGHPLHKRLYTALIETAANDYGYGDWAQAEVEKLGEPEAGDHDSMALFSLSTFMRARNLTYTAEETVETARRAIADDSLLRPGSSGVSHILPGMSLAVADRYEEGLQHCDRALRLAEKAGSMFSYSTLRIWRSIIHFRAGSLADSISEGEEGLRTAIALGNRPGPAWAAATVAEAYAETGDLDRAEDALRRAALRHGVGDTWHWVNYRLARGRIALFRGEPEAALADAREAGEMYEGVDSCRNPSLYSWRRLAIDALLTSGADPDEARRLAAEELELAEWWGGPRILSYAMRASGLIEGGKPGLELLEAAVDALDGSEARLELAYALVDLGAAKRRANRKAESREPLRHGMDLATSCGAGTLAERARAELRSSGVRARRTAISGVDSLTPSERRAAGLAAGGRTNKEIAQELFVTLKTVEVHLSNTYRKLEIGGRSELDQALVA